MKKNLDYAFDEFLKANAEEAAKTIPAFDKKLGSGTFRYGRVAIPSFYKSYFINPKQLHMMKRVAVTLTEVINTATRLYFEEGHLKYLFRMNPEAADLIKIDPGYSRNVVLSRFDALLEGDSLKLIELNCDSPAGAAYTDFCEQSFMAEEFPADFFEKYQIIGTDRVKGILSALLDAYEEFGGYENPTIAITDWRKSRTTPEFLFLQQYFESKGYKTVIADPREFVYKGGKLYFKNQKIQLVYRRAIFDEILERLDEVEDLIKAYKDRAICMVNPLRSRLASSKALLSILTNPEYEHFFTDNENRVKRDYLPWTRRLVDAEDFYGRKKVYLIDFLKDEKETLILKPSVGYGGEGVTIGCETPDSEWNAVIAKALKGDWVVQEYVNTPIMTVPVVINGALDFAYKKFNFNMLVFGGKFCGGFSRLSDESVINVARKGGLIPALVTEVMPDRFGA